MEYASYENLENIKKTYKIIDNNNIKYYIIGSNYLSLKNSFQKIKESLYFLVSL